MSDAQGTLPGFETEGGATPRLGRAAGLTARRARLVANGYHPLNQRKLRAEGGTCGDCARLVSRSYDKTYHKCDLGPISRGEATDVRLRWPACVLYEECRV